MNIRYNHLNKPTEITFEDGNRQTITYDGFGNKKRVDYAVGPATVIGGDIPADDSYTVSSSRRYSGKHIFTDGELEYLGFSGGYFGKDGTPNYYVNDWQGNVTVVLHGALNWMDYTAMQKNGAIWCAKEFTQALLNEFDSLDLSNINCKPLFIELYSCNTGRIDENYSNPIAQQISEELKNAIVKAPNGFLFYNFDTNSETVYYDNKNIGSEENPIFIKGENPATPAWRYFFRGQEIAPSDKMYCLILIILQQYLESEADNKIIQSH